MVIGTGLIDDSRKAVTADLKGKGNSLFLVGGTKDEMGGSLLFRKFGGVGGNVPGVDLPELKKIMDRLLEAMAAGLVQSCHDCSDGGFAVAMAEMCIAGGVGADIDLSKVGGTDAVRLYSESNTRWIAEILEKDEAAFKKIMGRTVTKIGRTEGERMKIKGSSVSLAVKDMRAAWKEPIERIMNAQPPEKKERPKAEPADKKDQNEKV
jgi:phosphoribosylformylglycinamidine synthase